VEMGDGAHGAVAGGVYVPSTWISKKDAQVSSGESLLPVEFGGG